MRKLLLSAGALVLAALLTACGGRAPDRSPAEAVGLDPAEPAAAVDGRTVPVWEYLYFLSNTCGDIAAACAGAGAELRWDDPRGTGTLADYAMEQALSTAALYATVETWAEEQGCALSDADRAAISAAWAEKAAASGGEEAYLAHLAELGLDRTGAEELAGVRRLYDQLLTLFQTEGSAIFPKPEDAADYAREAGYLTVDYIRVAFGEGAADKDTARARIAEAFAKLNGSAAPQGDFAVLAATYSDDAGRGDYPNGRTFLPGSGVLSGPLEAAALAMDEGEWSGVIEGGDGYYILLRRAPDLAATAAAYFDHRLLTAAAEAETQLSPAVEALTPEALCRALTP